MAIPTLRGAAEFYKNQDANDYGQDDLIGNTMDYIADLADWVLAGGMGNPPKPPEGLK